MSVYDGQFAMMQVSPDDWVIMDTQIDPGDARRLVACVSEYEGHVEVRWFRHVSLPDRFRTRDEALCALLSTRRADVAEPALV